MQKSILPYILCILFFAISLLNNLFCQVNTQNTSLSEVGNSNFEKDIAKHISRGWIGYSIDSIEEDLIINKGVRYRWGNVKIKECNYQETLNPKGYFKIGRINKINNKLLNPFLENGYPFANAIYSAKFRNDTIDLELTINKGSIFHYDTIVLDSSFAKDLNYIQNITFIKPDKKFNYKQIVHLQQTINNTGLFTAKAQSITYDNNKAKIKLDLKKNRTSSFTGIVGVQPDSDNKTIITGNASINLNNSFHKGERISFKWNKYDPKSQLIDINSDIPFFLNSPIGIEASAYIQKQDSTYTTTKITGGVSSMILNNGKISLRTSYYKSAYNNGGNVNSQSNMVGLGYSISKLNNYINPSKGFSVSTYTDIGNRKLQQNSSNNNYTRTDFEFTIQEFIPLYKFVLLIKNKTHIISSDSLNISELVKVGGNGSVRGFNENSIAADISTTFTIETRYLIDESLNIYLFTDCNVCNEPLSIENKNTRIGVGAGINVNTKVGILSIAYALGKHNKLPMKINEAKIHIAYINYF